MRATFVFSWDILNRKAAQLPKKQQSSLLYYSIHSVQRVTYTNVSQYHVLRVFWVFLNNKYHGI